MLADAEQARRLLLSKHACWQGASTLARPEHTCLLAGVGLGEYNDLPLSAFVVFTPSLGMSELREKMKFFLLSRQSAVECLRLCKQHGIFCRTDSTMQRFHPRRMQP
jgi:hypothetical protein